MRYLPYANFHAILDWGFRIDEELRRCLIKVEAPSNSFRHTRANQSKAAALAAIVNVVGNIPTTASPVISNREYRNVPLTYAADRSINVVGGGNNSNTNGKGGYRRNERHFDELHAPMSLIFQGLVAQEVLKPMEDYKPPNPLPAVWDHTKYCEYHRFSGTLPTSVMHSKAQSKILFKPYPMPNIVNNLVAAQ